MDSDSDHEDSMSSDNELAFPDIDFEDFDIPSAWAPLDSPNLHELIAQPAADLQSETTEAPVVGDSPTHAIVLDSDDDSSSAGEETEPLDSESEAPSETDDDQDNDDNSENANNLAILRVQIEDLQLQLQQDDIDESTRAAMEYQVQELEALIEDGGELVHFNHSLSQRDLGPPPEPVEPAEPPIPMQLDNEDHEMHECAACMDAFEGPRTVRLDCGDHYCRGCFRELVEDAMRNENIFPPRCCNTVPEATILSVLGKTFMRRYKARKIEIETAVNRRVYCSNASCAHFLGPRPLKVKTSRRMCRRCHNFTCTRCGAIAQKEEEETYHTECTAGEHDEQFLDAVRAAGFQQCSSCLRFIELNFGCNHMSCLCGHEFCYVCGERWKTCGCEQWREDRLYARAAQIVDRPGVRPRDANRRRQCIDETATYLLAHHDCRHERKWKSICRRLRCEDCGKLRGNIIQCPGCRLRVCKGCKGGRRRLP